MISIITERLCSSTHFLSTKVLAFQGRFLFKTYKGGYEVKGKDNYDFFLRTGALPNFAKLMGDSIKFWKDMYAHPNYDEFWKARNARANVAGIKPAMLIVGGLFDAEDCYGAWRLYEAIEEKNPRQFKTK
jgi:predicted acyl esterase